MIKKGKNNSKNTTTLQKDYKRIGSILLILILLMNIAFLTKEVVKREYIEEKQAIRSFSNSPTVVYSVQVKPNPIYNGAKLPESQGYFKSIVDSITVNIKNKYMGEEKAKLKGDYTLRGEITGLEQSPDEPTVAWQKQFTLIPKKTFETTENEFLLSQDYKIDFDHYNNFAEQVNALTGYDSSNYLKVYMDINYRVTTKDGEIAENIKPALVIPLGLDYFKITKEGVEEKKSEIVKTVQVRAPLNIPKLLILSIISLLCIIALFILKYKTAEPSPEDYHMKKMKKLLREYGKRLVSVETDMIEEISSICRVHSMGDMVKISDEIERPIFYVHQDNICAIKKFFIIEDHKAYIYKVSEPEVKVDQIKFKDQENEADSVPGSI